MQLYPQLNGRTIAGRELKSLDKKLFWEEINLDTNKKEVERMLILDPVAREFGNGMKNSCNIVPIINDCRINIKSNKLTQNDELTQNTEFIAATINGWPSAFVVTTKKIVKGKDLWCYYGDLYHTAMIELESWSKKCNISYQKLKKIITKDDFDVETDGFESYLLE